MDPVAKRLKDLLGIDVIKIDDCIGNNVLHAINKVKKGNVVLLENVRFYKEELVCEDGFSRELSRLADLYVNDAFGVVYRKHSSIVGVPKFLPAAAGLLLHQEVTSLNRILKSPKRPFIAILGGLKVTTKVKAIRGLLDKVDTMLIGGGMCYSFLKAMGFNVGDSPVEEDAMDTILEILEEMKRRKTNVVFPADHVIFPSDGDKEGNGCKVVNRGQIPVGWKGMDLGPRGIKEFTGYIQEARTVFWNGPLGAYEQIQFCQGTEQIGRSLLRSDLFSIIGGGDLVAALRQKGLDKGFSFISTGGGSLISFIGGEPAPGIEALWSKNSDFQDK
jgi:phosphoglycerate kinase